MSDQTLVVSSAVSAETYKAVLTLEEALQRQTDNNRIFAKVLRPGIDYGAAGPGKLPSLKKPGAEKLCSIGGYSPRFTLTEKIQDWTGDEHGGHSLFAYTFDCLIWRGDIYLGQASGHCNSWESRYRWRWMAQDQLPAGMDVSRFLRRDMTIEEYQWAIEKRDTMPPYGKSPEYWDQFNEAIASGRAEQIMKKTKNGRSFPAYRIVGTQFRVPNPDIFDIVNTCLKIAHKRAFVAAILLVANASDAFTQDMDDDVDDHPPSQPQPAPPPIDDEPPFDPTPPAPPVHPELQAIFAKMAKGTRDQRLEEFAKLKRELVQIWGEESGEKAYYNCLEHHRVKHASEFQALNKANDCIADLFKIVLESRGEGLS